MATASSIQLSPGLSRAHVSKSHCVLCRCPLISRPCRRLLKLWENPVYDWEWDSLPGPPPTKYLHLCGYGHFFHHLMTLKYQAFWAGEDACTTIPTPPPSIDFDHTVLLRCPLFLFPPVTVAPRCFQANYQVDTRFITTLVSVVRQDRNSSCSTEELFPSFLIRGAPLP
jgi:hypothetical protein